MLLFLPMSTIMCVPKTILLYFIFGFNIPSTMVPELMDFEMPFLLGNAFNHLIAVATSPIVMTLVIYLYGKARVIVLHFSLTVLFDLSIMPVYSSFPQTWNNTGSCDFLILSLLNSLLPWIFSTIKPLVSYTCLISLRVLVILLALLDLWYFAVVKLIFVDLLVRNACPFT